MRYLLLCGLLCIGLVTQAQAKVVGKEVDYQTGETTLKGYLAYDTTIKGKRPGVLVVHEWWGHNDYARQRAHMLAKLGYVALAVDMYGDGKQATHPEDAQKFSAEITNNMPMGQTRFEAAMTLLKKHTLTDQTDIAAIGYCFGGAVVLQMAREGLDLDAVVSFHGSLGTSKPAQPNTVKAKVMVAHGGADPFVKPEQITDFMSEMNQAGVDYRFTAYGDAQHSFTNPAADTVGEKFNLPLKYSKQADEDSWRDMQFFLQQAFAD